MRRQDLLRPMSTQIRSSSFRSVTKTQKPFLVEDLWTYTSIRIQIVILVLEVLHFAIFISSPQSDFREETYPLYAGLERCVLSSRGAVRSSQVNQHLGEKKWEEAGDPDAFT